MSASANQIQRTDLAPCRGRVPDAAMRIGYSTSQASREIASRRFGYLLKLGTRASAALVSPVDARIAARLAVATRGREQ